MQRWNNKAKINRTNIEKDIKDKKELCSSDDCKRKRAKETSFTPIFLYLLLCFGIVEIVHCK